MRHALKVFSLIALLLIPISPMSAETLQQAPLNPAFVEYQHETFKASGSGETVYPAGRTPSPVDLSHLAGKSLLPSGKMAAASTFPASYDLRELGFVSPVRNQNPYGTCWTFAAMASMESTAMKLLGAESADLAEWNLAYYGYIDESDELVGFENYNAADFNPGTGDPNDWSVNSGGDDFKAAAILSRWTGPAWESEVPYDGNAPDGTEPDAYHLSDVMFLYYDADSRYAPVSIENLKHALMNYGVVSVGVFAEPGWADPERPSPYFNLVTSATYIPSDNLDGLKVGSANHAVAIIGWDDNFAASNFSETPPGDGAWIVRNSWGTGWGNEGYFYLSYYDAVLDTGAAYISAPADNFEHIYQYDPLGLCTMTGIPGDLTPESAWMANIFVAEYVEALTAVSFYTPAVDSAYEISVFTGVEDAPTSGALALHAQTGTLHEPGYRTVRLDNPVLLSAGQKFSIVVKLTTPGYDFPIAVEARMMDYSDKAAASPGESFFSDDGVSWTDTTDVEPTANVCLKAFTFSVTPGELPAEDDTASPGDILKIQEDLEGIDEMSLLRQLDDALLAGTLQVISHDDPVPLVPLSADLIGDWYTVSFNNHRTWNGDFVSYDAYVAYNYVTGTFDVPDIEEQQAPAAKELSASDTGDTDTILLLDGGPFEDPQSKDGKISNVKLAKVSVLAEVAETPTRTGGGGGCQFAFFTPAALILLAPLALLKKK